ncbi:transposase [Nocardioides soli]|uniref:transposase n=1 Tax=Nocardioides soli TaxID=1036020 RepID=UPI001C8644E2|nr:transposase [Nocardioides soli]
MSTIDPSIDAASRHDLTEEQWELLEPLLPTPSRPGRPRRWPLRQLIDGIRHRTRVGCPWRDVPDRYGPWWRIYALFACWHLLIPASAPIASTRSSTERVLTPWT